MISFLLTAFHEENTIGKAIDCLVTPEYSGYTGDFELLLGCPDPETYAAAIIKVKELGIENKFKWVQDPGKKEGKGKPTGLNMLVNAAKGDILIFTDGDVYFDKNAVIEIIKTFEDPEVQLTTGRPVSGDSINSMMGYFGHLLADAAHHKRNIELLGTISPTTKLISKTGFFPVSGYIWALRKSFINKLPKTKEMVGGKEITGIFPEHTLVDDAFVSYLVHNSGGKIGYAPEARAFVKYPTNLNDYFKQKKRSTGGYVQLWEHGVVRPETKSRSFGKELEYFWFPIKYAKSLKQFWWSLMLYPTRLWLWIMIFWERRVTKKDFVKTWVRIESTK